jgi:hypothetical protein
MVISLFQMTRSLETVGWWKEVIKKGAFLFIGLSFIFVELILWMVGKRRMQEKIYQKKFAIYGSS